MVRLRTIVELIHHFVDSRRWFLLPLLLVLLLSSVLLVLTGGLSYVAPFVYALF
jgi:Family of unknown function (DUF5989)